MAEFDSSSELGQALAELPWPKRGRKGQPIIAEVIREIQPSDLPLQHPTQAPVKSITKIRYSHHQLAQLLAIGQVSQEEAGLITGYAPSYISILQGDPAFQELLAYYSGQQEQKFADVLERMRTLGLSGVDELQSRLEADPDSFAKRELMELVELMLVKPMTAARSALPAQTPGGGGGVNVQVNFVTAKPVPEGGAAAVQGEAPILDLEPIK